jgi:hypothetical protein
MKTLLSVTALALFALPSFAQSNTPQALCTAYFGVLQYDPRVPGFFVAAMSSSQAKWLAKSGQKHYPGLCLSLEKAKYLIVWTTSTQVATTERTVHKTAQLDTSTTGSERGTFDTYGALSTWGSYSGSFSSNSASTLRYDEVVPVITATDHCSIYVLKSVGATVWEDVRNKTSQPRAIFFGEALRPRPGSSESDPSGAAHIRYLFGKEPTAHALDGALKFIFEHGAQTMPVAALLPREEKSGDQVAATTQPEQTQVLTTVETSPAKQKAVSGETGSSSANLQVKPWNRTAIRAEFVELAGSDKKDAIRLWYTLTNTTDADYKIENMRGITTAVSAHGATDFLYAFNGGMISLEMPLIIPAHRKIRVILTVALQTDKSVADDASDAAVTIYKKDVMIFLQSKYSKMQGFVLMDDGTRYEIDFSFAWPEAVER